MHHSGKLYWHHNHYVKVSIFNNLIQFKVIEVQQTPIHKDNIIILTNNDLARSAQLHKEENSNNHGNCEIYLLSKYLH